MNNLLLPLSARGAFVFFALVLSVKADTLDLGLLAHFKLDGNAVDSSGNGFSGEIVGSISGTTDRFGNANSALSFDKNGYVNVGGINLLNGATSAAIAGWVKNRVGINEGGFVVGAGDSGQGQDPFTIRFAGDKLVEAIFTETSKGPFHPDRFVGFEGDLPNLALPQNEWVSFVSQFSSFGGETIYQLYLNGSLAVETNYARSHDVDYARNMPVQIGALTGFTDSQFRGDIDDIRFYDRTLTLGEVKRLTHANVPETGSTVVYLALACVGLYMWQRKRATGI